MIQRSSDHPENSFEAETLRQQIQEAQDLGQVSFLNTASGMSLRISPQQSANGAIRAVLGFEGNLQDVSFSLTADPDAQFYSSASRLEGEGGLSAEKVAEFYQNNPLDSFAGFEPFRSAVNDALGFIDLNEWMDLISEMPMPVSPLVQRLILVPMLEMGELGDVCEVVEKHLRACNWSESDIKLAFNPDTREVRLSRFRFQELTDVSVAAIHGADQLRDALASLEFDRFDPDEPNDFAELDKSEALRCFVKGQAFNIGAGDVDELLTILKPFWREFTDEDMQAVRKEISHRGWGPMSIPRIRFDQFDDAS